MLQKRGYGFILYQTVFTVLKCIPSNSFVHSSEASFKGAMCTARYKHTCGLAEVDNTLLTREKMFFPATHSRIVVKATSNGLGAYPSGLPIYPSIPTWEFPTAILLSHVYAAKALASMQELGANRRAKLRGNGRGPFAESVRRYPKEIVCVRLFLRVDATLTARCLLRTGAKTMAHSTPMAERQRLSIRSKEGVS